jgi:hypothetical protein
MLAMAHGNEMYAVLTYKVAKTSATRLNEDHKVQKVVACSTHQVLHQKRKLVNLDPLTSKDNHVKSHLR